MNWQPPAFERHQFAGKRRKAVIAIYTPEGWDTTGISFGDLQLSMHVHRREVVQERRLPTPAWANNNEALREEVLKFCEKRLYLTTFRHIPGLTHEERHARIRQTERLHLRRWLGVLQRLRERYKTEPEEKKPELETQIQNVDTQCCLMRRGNVAVTAAVVHFYYRLGWNSVDVAKELNLQPPHVRQILARLLHSASGITQGREWARPPRSGPDFDLMMKWHSEGMPLNELTLRLRLLGYSPLRLSTVYRALENIKETHFEKLQEQVAEAEAVFACIPRRKSRTSEHRAKLSAAAKARWASPGFRDKVIDEMRAVGKRRSYAPRTLEHRAKLSAATKATYATGKRGPSTPETRAKQSAGLKTHWANVTPEFRARVTAKIKASWVRRRAEGKAGKPHSLESRAKQSASLKTAWQDPEKKIRLLAGRKATTAAA